MKPATVYAYVSRGVLARHRSPEGSSLFNAAEIDRFARRGRPRRSRADEVVIESRITALGADRPFYRGRDALELAVSAPSRRSPSGYGPASPARWRSGRTPGSLTRLG